MSDMEQDLRDTLRSLMASRTELTPDDLVDLGWPEVFEEDGRLAVTTLFEEAGRVAVATAGRDVLVSLMLSDCGGRGLTIVEQDGVLAGTADGDVFEVRRAAVTSDPTSVVVLDRRGAEVLDVAEVDAESSWTTDEVAGANRGSTLRMVSGKGRLRRRRARPEVEAIDRMILLALSHERCGVGQGLLDVAVAHVSERRQFGVSIGSLQAVQHRLAGVKVALEAALSTLDAAWDSPSEISTMVAVSTSATALVEAVRDCLQVCGGMGFTDEFGLAMLMRRAVILQGTGPSARDAEILIGRRLVESGVVRLGEIDQTARR